MREIKFRGKRLDNGEWVYGNLVELRNPFNHEDSPACFIMPKEVNIADPDSIAEQEVVDPATVGQFTGRLDSEGREICEGDVIKVIHSFALAFGCNRKQKIRGAYDLEWQKDDFGQDGVTYFRNYQIELGRRDFWIGRNGSVQHPLRNLSGFIIGNIHDNPELLNNE